MLHVVQKQILVMVSNEIFFILHLYFIHYITDVYSVV